MDKFKRKTYGNFGQFWSDVRFLAKRRKGIKTAMKGDLISPAFRERLMLAVTAVIGCRYCSQVHTREALVAGISNDEVKKLLSGVVNDCPDKEVIALIYAQHWADSNTNPDPKARQKLVETYGKDTTETLELVLRMIWTGNMMGNTWDRFLHLLSFGHCGL